MSRRIRRSVAIDVILQVIKSKGFFWCDWISDGPTRSKCKELIDRGLIVESFRNKHGVGYKLAKTNNLKKENNTSSS
jgi:hypothetical protein